MTKAERNLLMQLAICILDGWPKTPMADRIEQAMNMLESEDLEAAHAAECKDESDALPR